MIVVAICDDEIKINAEIERTLIDIFNKLNIKYEIDVFFTGDELCQKIETGAHYDLIFLDIMFAKDEINGVEIGRLIRDAYNNFMVSIVYISWEKNYAMQLFEIQPFNFLVKPLDYKQIETVIIRYLKIAKFWSGSFTYKKGHDTFKVSIKDIVYLESSDRKLVLHLSNGKKEEFYGSIKEAYQKQLKKFDFLFIHNSYVVNYDYITALKFDKVILIDNVTTLPISKHRKSDVKENYYTIMKRREV